MISSDIKPLSAWLTLLENRHSHEIQLGLSRVCKVAQTMGLLAPKALVITVAGTNGKGSTVRALETIYMAAGYRVASYTSPHLFRFNERICVNQVPIDDVTLCQIFTLIEVAREKIPLTYFETTTLAALWYFEQQQPDVTILEVGMGGRLDAVNIIDSDLAVITSIDYDHQAYLGDTLEAIAGEKAGIMRAAKPCIYADYNAPGRISAHATAQQTSVYMLGIDFFYSTFDASLQIILPNQRLTVPAPSIEPKSAVAAIVAVQLLQQKLTVTEATLQQAMHHIHIVGRQQWLDIPFPTLYDVAHNPQAVRSLRDGLQQRHAKGRILAIFSALADKDIAGNIAPLKGLVDHWYPVVLAVKRAVNEDKLRLAFQANDVMIDDYYFDPLAAYQAALDVAVPGDAIIVYGSFYLIGGIMGQFVTL